METGYVFGLSIGQVVHERGACDAEAVVQAGQVLPDGETVRAFWEFVAVEQHPPHVIGIRAKGFARHNGVDEGLDQSSVEGIALVDLGHGGSGGFRSGDGGVSAGVVNQEDPVDSLGEERCARLLR